MFLEVGMSSSSTAFLVVVCVCNSIHILQNLLLFVRLPVLMCLLGINLFKGQGWAGSVVLMSWLQSWRHCACGFAVGVSLLCTRFTFRLVREKKSTAVATLIFVRQYTLCTSSNKSIRRNADDCLECSLGVFPLGQCSLVIGCSLLLIEGWSKDLVLCAIFFLDCPWLGCLLKGSNGSFAFCGVHMRFVRSHRLNPKTHCL